MKQIHVIGGGLAGLAAALSLTASGRAVVLHEAGRIAGGRCRSYLDRELDLWIDNGNHLLLSGNAAARAYIAEIGATEEFHIAEQAVFPFLDLKTEQRWTVRPNRGRLPWWILRSDRRVPGTHLSDYWDMARIVRCRDDTAVADSMRRGGLYWRLLEPLAIAALNTTPHEGLARLLGTVMRETLMRGGQACIPMIPQQNLSAALIDPAIRMLRARGAEIRFNSRIAALCVSDNRVTGLRGPDGPISIEADQAVVLAVPPWVATDLLPDLVAPIAFESILNIHFAHQAAIDGPLSQSGFIGLISGVAQWVFIKPAHVSVTISAANDRIDQPAANLAASVWPDVAQALGLPEAAKHKMPSYRVIKEKRATFAATAQQEARRPQVRTKIAANLALAGDWTNTGLPATIEGAIRSGRSAAEFLLSL